MLEIWFWQRIISPHVAGLAVALTRLGCKVTYAAEQAMSSDRAKQGWRVPMLEGADLVYVQNRTDVRSIVAAAPEDAVHICQGIRANGLVANAQRLLASRRLRQWVMMETINDANWLGWLKRAEYSRLFHRRGASLEGVLAAGHRTGNWISARGMPGPKVFPFAYFLPDENSSASLLERNPGPFRFVYIGQLISRKRVDWLIDALASLEDQTYELWIVGAGSDEVALRTLATRRLGRPVTWYGQMSLFEVPAVMAQADCLVLPSLHDGWGAVASEALMTGTPVICSDACGVAGVVQASGVGGVFHVHDKSGLARLLSAQLAGGTLPSNSRRAIADWAKCLGASAGAAYLREILTYKTTGQGVRPEAPWLRERRQCVG